MMRVKQRNVAKPKRRVIAIITVIMMVISIVSLTILAVAEDVYYVPVVEAADEYTPHEPSLSDTESNTASDSDSEHDSEQEDNESDSSDSGENTDNDVDIVLTCDISDNQSDDSYYAHDTCESGDKHQYDNEEYEEALCTCECKGYCDYDCTCECEDCYVEIEALVDFVVTDWNGLHEVFTNLMTTDGPYTVDVAGSITMNSQLNIPVGRTVNLTGGVLYQPTANARHFTVEGTLILNGITLRGTGTATYRGGIMVNGGELIMSAGSVIEGNRAIFGGGVHNNGIFTMTGGTISYNLVWDGNWGGDGGGVYNTGTFAMTDGEIFRNQSEDGGGGISSRGTFILSGGTIRNNGANGGSGVDILNGEFVMTAGSIINNGGWFGPGGVLVRSGTFTMHGGEVSRNSSLGAGGVVISSNSTFIMHNGEINENHATRHSGGVANFGQFTMYGGSISGNTVFSMETGVGTGAGVDNWGAFTMNGGIISNNTANGGFTWGSRVIVSVGGGVNNDSQGIFTMNDGTITGNTAVHGGGVYSEGSFTMRGGRISGNIALENGESVWWDESVRIGVHFIDLGMSSMTGGYIANNTDVEVAVVYNTQVNIANVPILERIGYSFTGWLVGDELLTNTELAEIVVDAPMTLIAQWERNPNYWFTATFAPGAQGAFTEQVFTDILHGTATPAFVGTPTGNEGWLFTGWSPTVATTVTANVTYVAQWEAIEPDPEYRSIRIYYYFLNDGVLERDVENNADGRQHYGVVGDAFNLEIIGVLDRNELADDNEYVFVGWRIYVGGVQDQTYLEMNTSSLFATFTVPGVLSTGELPLSENMAALNDLVIGDTIRLLAVWSIYEYGEENGNGDGNDNNDTTAPGGGNQQKLPQTGIESSVRLWSALFILMLIAGVDAGVRIRNIKRKGNTKK